VTDIFEFKSYLLPVGVKALRQFERAASKNLTRLEDELALHLYDDASYYPVANRKDIVGRNHLTARSVKTGKESLGSNALFANCLTVAEHDDPLYQSPSKRVVVGPLAIYTFEFDECDLSFFREQLSWLRSKGKKPLDCPMGDFFKTCSQWADFKGVTVCWSGHKSLHIHTVFDTAPFLARFAQPGPNAREGMIAHWDKLEASLLDDLGLANSSHRPDPQLKYPEQYRRLPNGLRQIDKDNHLLGVPRGMMVPQLTLWQEWRDRTSKNAATLFHDPVLFAPRPSQKRATTSSRITGIGHLTEVQVAHCEARLREIYPDGAWPRLARLGFDSGHWKAWFYNCEEDENPASFLRDDYRTISLQGRGSEGLSPACLDASLGEQMSEWLAELGPVTETEEEVERPSHLNRSPLAHAFMAASSLGEAAEAIEEHLPRSILYKRWLLLQANEGASKTSTIMRKHSWIVEYLRLLDDTDPTSPRQSLYTFASYTEAEAKCVDFNQLHSESEFVGMVLPSFSRAYEDACRELRITSITQEKAAQQNFSSLWAAVTAQQPRVIDWLRDQHTKRWSKIAGRNPVWFTVHQVAHGWHRSSPTRLMAAKSFWSVDERDRAAHCRAETHLSLLIHDEVKTSTFVTMARDEQKQWIDSLRSSASRHWSELDLSARVAAFRNLSGVMPPPTGLDFNTAASLASVGDWSSVVTADTGEYASDFGDRDIYQPCHGNQWWCSPQRWWRDADAQRVVFLTTEEVPTAVAERADRSISIWRLDAPLLPQDLLDVHPERGITGKNLSKKIDKWRSMHGEDWFAVSNKLGGAPNSLTHARARGSNALIGRKIVQTMTFITPDEYEQLQALNAWCGRDDLVLLRHIDECNQTAGRNLGFRHRPGAENALLIHPNLMKLIEPVLGYSRYNFRIHESGNQRRTIKRRASNDRSRGPHGEASNDNSQGDPSSTEQSTSKKE
jgi:hypothetical protein